ncbi:MAG: SRPBCC family protein [Bryobacteraceae bacterium]|jgi:uncharacterized protein YndB with AHSA1/START domain
MTASGLSTVERSTLVRAPRSRVWQALTNLKEFSKWFGVEAEGEFAPGARIRMISTHDSHKGQEFFVDVVKMEAPETFSWRWSPGSKQPGEDTSGEPMTLVEFRLTEVEGGTLLTVVESGFDRLSLARRARVFEENSKGWEFQLASLNRYAGQTA